MLVVLPEEENIFSIFLLFFSFFAYSEHFLKSPSGTISLPMAQTSVEAKCALHLGCLEAGNFHVESSSSGIFRDLMELDGKASS